MSRTAERRRELRKSNESRRARGPSLTPGGQDVVFGSLFLLAGLYVLLCALDVIKADDDSFHAPRWVVAVIGTMFMTAGVLISLNAILAMRRRSRLKTQSTRFPGEPWRADHEWRSLYCLDESGKQIPATFFFAAFLAMFFGPLAYLYLGLSKAGSWAFAIGVCFLIPILIVLWQVIKLSVRQFRYGGGRMEYDNMPLVAGQKLKMKWRGKGAIGPYEKITFTLRCIEEKIQTRRRNNNSRQYLRAEQWVESFVIDGPGEHLADEVIDVYYDLPADVPSTQLNHDPPRYWEVEMSVETSDVEFGQSFLVPIYTADQVGVA